MQQIIHVMEETERIYSYTNKVQYLEKLAKNSQLALHKSILTYVKLF